MIDPDDCHHHRTTPTGTPGETECDRCGHRQTFTPLAPVVPIGTGARRRGLAHVAALREVIAAATPPPSLTDPDTEAAHDHHR